jgi:hypothetical protein
VSFTLPLAPKPTERASLRRHTNEVVAIAIAPDGKTLASASHDKTVKLWDLTAAKEQATLRGHTGLLDCVAITPDGKLLASGGRDQKIKLWDLTTGRGLITLEGHTGGVRALANSPDGKRFASGSRDSTIRLWDLVTRKEQATLTTSGSVLHLAFSPNSQTLAAAVGGQPVMVWDVATGKERARLIQNDTAQAVAFTPDGKTLVVGGNYRGIRLWEMATGLERADFLGQALRIICLALTPDGLTLAAGGHGPIVELWDMTTGKVLAALPGEAHFITAVAFTPDGRTLAAAEAPDTTIRLWEVSALTAAASLPPSRLTDGQLESLWSDLAGSDASRAYQAIWSLARAGPQAVSWLDEHLRPVAAPEPQRIVRLLAELNSNRFAAREQASRELERLGESAGPGLKEAAANRPSPEVRQRVEQLLERLEQPSRSPERLRVLRAIEVLEHIASPAARRELERLAGGLPEARLTQEARASLARLVTGARLRAPVRPPGSGS